MTEEHNQARSEVNLQVPAGYLDIVKLYMQQYGLLTFGTVTTLLMQHFIITPQQERANLRDEIQMQVIQKLERVESDFADDTRHLRQTAELLDRALIRQEKRE